VRSKIVGNVVASQVALFTGWGICVAVVPRFLFERNEGGVSNFGIHAETVVPYSLAFLLCSVFVLRAAGGVEGIDEGCRRFRLELHVLACLLLFVLVTTYAYKANSFLHGLHIAAGVLITCFESLASCWMVASLVRSTGTLVLLGLQLLGFFMAALTFFGRVHLLFASQLLTSFAFGLLLICAARVVEDRNSVARRSSARQ
jgi:hypothetical protein